MKCQLSTEDVRECSECLKRGINCTVNAGDDPVANGQHELSSNITEDRLERIERMLSKLIREGESPRSSRPASEYNSLCASTSTSESHNQASPLLWLLRDCVMDQHPGRDNAIKDEVHLSQLIQPESIANGSTSRSTRHEPRPNDHSKKDYLVSLLPSQHDANMISSNSNAWFMELPCPHTLYPTPIPNIDIATITASNSMQVSKALLYLALYTQQLPHEFDAKQLDMRDVDSRVRTYIDAANSLILSDDEEACSLDGVECLVLLGIIHINEGALRRAWLTFRRGLSIAQLIGVHTDSLKVAKELDVTKRALYQKLWLCAIIGDSYASLHLGLRPGVGIEPFGPDDGWDYLLTDYNPNFLRKMCGISIRISERNLAGSTQSYGLTESIDDMIEDARKRMTESWWSIPKLTTERSPEMAEALEHVWSHVWFHKLRIFAHIPFIFRAMKERKFEYSWTTCIDSSRQILHRYLALRRSNNSRLHCRAIDFGAFIAALTMVLLMVEDSTNRSGRWNVNEERADRGLIDEVVISMESLGQSDPREFIARQGVSFIKSVLALGEHSSPEPRSLRLVVPHFGTVKITMGPSKTFRTESTPSKVADSAGQPPLDSPCCPTIGKEPESVTQQMSFATAPSPSFSMDILNTEFSFPSPELLETWDLSDYDSMWDTNLT